MLSESFRGSSARLPCTCFSWNRRFARGLRALRRHYHFSYRSTGSTALIDVVGIFPWFVGSLALYVFLLEQEVRTWIARSAAALPLLVPINRFDGANRCCRNLSVVRRLACPVRVSLGTGGSHVDCALCGGITTSRTDQQIRRR